MMGNFGCGYMKIKCSNFFGIGVYFLVDRLCFCVLVGFDICLILMLKVRSL